jgi:LysM repeat protein
VALAMMFLLFAEASVALANNKTIHNADGKGMLKPLPETNAVYNMVDLVGGEGAMDMSVVVEEVSVVNAGINATPVVEVPESYGYHVVSYGETLSGIGYAYGVYWHDIAYANGISYPYYIYAGQTLHIPYGYYNHCGYGYYCHGYGYGGYHTVSYGETLSNIGYAYGVNWYTIADWNGIGYPYYIYAGQTIYIP